jgi:hypothetical protein
MKAIDDASTQAASTMRRCRGAISRPSARGHGWASMTPRSHGSMKGCAMAKYRYHAQERLSNNRHRCHTLSVMRGLDPRIHDATQRPMPYAAFVGRPHGLPGQARQ